MRTFYLFQVLLWLTIITFSNSTHAQLYEISFDQRLDQSSLIVEGKVIETKSYRGNDGKIYTANKIQVFSVLKGNLQNPKITIITLGGTVGSKRETWTNVLTLSKHQTGVFFLTTTHRPLSEEIEDNWYKGEILNRIAINQYRFNETKLALKTFNDALYYSQLSKNYKAIGSTYSMIGTIFRINGVYSRAIEYFIKCCVCYLDMHIYLV